MYKYIFRCDANKKVGLGHLMRSLNLARALLKMNKDGECFFYGDFNKFSKELLKKYSIEYIENNKKILSNSYIIIDSYYITLEEVKALKSVAKKLIKIDDFNNSSLTDYDLIVNFRVKAGDLIYKQKNVSLGLNYFLVKPELQKLRRKNIAKNNQNYNNILIFIGGTDLYNISYKIAEILDGIVLKKNIRLITNNNNNNNNNNNKFKENTFEILPLTNSIEKYYANTDLIITGGGLSKYEAGYCCLANASISQTKYQYKDTSIMAREGLTFDLGMAETFTKKKYFLKTRLEKFLSNETQEKIIKNCKYKFFINSTENFAKKILEL